MKADIMWLASVDSTNEEAKRRISDIDNLSVLSAFEQVSGRGQRGNGWLSNPGENLTFSIVLKFRNDSTDVAQEDRLPYLPAKEQFILTETASISAVEFLKTHGIQAKIKWPNDIYVGTKKIGGILIENNIRGTGISSSIIGIGLNINQRNFDVNLPNPTSVILERENFTHHGKDVASLDLRSCLNGFMDIFVSYIKELPFRNLRDNYLAHLMHLNVHSIFIDYATSPARQFRGMIRGVSPSGLLSVEDTEKGELKEFAFKEIGYIL